MKCVLLLLILGALAGCATPQPIQPTAYQKAQWKCEHDAYGGHASGLLAVALYHDCMRAHGWSK